VSELPLKIELELFEQVRAAPETDLLRVALRVTGGSGPVGRPTLLLELGDRAQRRLPILAPPDIEGVLRAAYAVAANRLTDKTKFALEFEGGAIVDLPTPIPGQARAGREEVAAQADGSPRDSSRTKAELRSELDVAREQAAIAQSREIEFAALAIEAGSAASELQAECERLSALNAELDVPPPDDSALVEAAQTARRQAEERAADAISVAATARQRTAELEARATELEGAAAEAAERVTGLEWAVADAERVNGSLEHDLASVREVLTQRDQALAHARDELRIMTVERDELTRQVAAYDGVAMKARERAKHADEASAASASALNELQSWRTDLERRLAETTAELASSRSARQAAETEVRSLRGMLAETEAKVELAEGRTGSLDAELRDARAEERDAKLELIRKSAEQRANEEAEREIRDAADARRSGLS
jgi:chromosome segregation ATPase